MYMFKDFSVFDGAKAGAETIRLNLNLERIQTKIKVRSSGLKCI